MTEASEKVRGIEYLPIFPLPLVLLPNELLPLHIFEPRYRQMLNDVQEKKSLFGISFFDAEEGFETRPEIGSIGCVAEVREVQTMPDQRSNILTVGLIRYRLVDYIDLGTPYLTAEVEFFEDEIESEKGLTEVADEVFSLFERIAQAAFKLSGNRGRFPEIQRAEPEPLSFLVTAAFNLDNEAKYGLLKMTSTSERLKKLRGFLNQAVGQMESSAEIQKISQTNGHSKKKLDI